MVIKVSLEEILETIDDETCLQDDDFQDPDTVKDDLCDIAEVNDDVRHWVDEAGIDMAVKSVMEHKKNPYIGVEKYIGLMLRIMKKQGSSAEEIKKCVNNIYEQYEVPEEHRKELFNTKEKE